MGLTRDFKESIVARAQRDARFRQALFTEAINAYLMGDTTGKAILRDLVNATAQARRSRANFRRNSLRWQRCVMCQTWPAIRWRFARGIASLLTGAVFWPKSGL